MIKTFQITVECDNKEAFRLFVYGLIINGSQITTSLYEPKDGWEIISMGDALPPRAKPSPEDKKTIETFFKMLDDALTAKEITRDQYKIFYGRFVDALEDGSEK